MVSSFFNHRLHGFIVFQSQKHFKGKPKPMMQTVFMVLFLLSISVKFQIPNSPFQNEHHP